MGLKIWSIFYKTNDCKSHTCRSDTVSEKSPSVKARLLMFIFPWRNCGP